MAQPQTFRPDPTFYASPRLASEAPAEKHGFTVLLSTDHARPDAIAVVDLDPASPDYGKVVHTVHATTPGDEFHHSAGTPARRRCRRSPATRSSSGATSSSRACARRASTSSTPSPIRARPRSSR